MPAAFLLANSLLALAALDPLALPAPSQESLELAPAWQIESFRDDAGVTECAVFDIDFAVDGTGWFATSAGLLRYDGYRWRRFTIADGLPSEHVRCVRVASDGRLWVGTDGGAGVFDGEAFDFAQARGRLAGPSVRRIFEDSSGALWFCCDRWPEAQVESGLTRLKDDEWRTWSDADGLPSDYVSDVFQAMDGRLFVLTNTGLAELTPDDEFARPLEDAGVWVGDSYVWSMVESARHGLIVATGSHFFQERGGVWRRLPNDVPGLEFGKLCTTSDGEVLACSAGDELRFLAFDGERFVPVTASVHHMGSGQEIVKEDPLGGIWCGGFERLARWSRRDPVWRTFPELGVPLVRDGAGGVWFQGEPGTLLRRDEQGIERIAGSPPVVAGPDGSVWYCADDGIVHIRGGERTSLAPPSEVPSDSPIRAVAGGALWCVGTGADGNLLLQRFDGARWITLELDALGAQHFVGGIEEDPSGGVWCLLHGVGGAPHRLLRVLGERIVEVELPDRSQLTSLPQLLVDRRGRRWLHGFFGLYRSDSGDLGWQRVELPHASVFQAADVGGVVWLGTRGYLGGDGGLLRERGAGFEELRGFRGAFVGQDADARFFSAGAELATIRAGADPPVLFACPTGDTVSRVVRSATGELWVRAGERTLLWSSPEHPPETLVHAHDVSLNADDRLVAQVDARAYMRPGQHTGAVVGAWRIDDEPWSSWEVLPGLLELPVAGIGEHVLRVRVRDEAGQPDPSPAVLTFRVLPVPLQQRRWFAPAVVGLVLLLVALTGLTLFGRHRLAVQAHTLERTVTRRTAELFASEQQFRTLFEQSGDAVLLFDLDGTLKKGNRAAAELIGSPSGVLPSSLAELFVSSDDVAHFQRMVADAGDVRSRRFAVRKLAGGRVDVLLSARLWSDELRGADLWQVVLHDVRAQVQLEEREREAQKMEALGRMAGGVAHDFNNILTIILGYGQLARDRVEATPEIVAELDLVLDAARRARSLTDQIQVFGRTRVGEPRVLDTSAELRAIVERLRELVGDSDLQLDAGRVGCIRMDAHQLEQVVVNLAVNAAHAMPSGGRISISARDVPDPKGGDDRVLLEVLDTGCGMDADTRRHALEPFFTTKRIGQGTGLGLAIVYGIVQQAQGEIEIESEPDAGTRFRIFLPSTAEPASALLDEPEQPRELGGDERILLVEDEEHIRELVRRTLLAHGYHVDVASTADEALDMLDAATRAPDLVLTDIVMPGTSGLEFVRRLRARDPGLPVLVMSGYPRPDASGGVLAELGVPFVAKPFRPSTLVLRMREALAGRARARR